MYDMAPRVRQSRGFRPKIFFSTKLQINSESPKTDSKPTFSIFLKIFTLRKILTQKKFDFFQKIEKIIIVQNDFVSSKRHNRPTFWHTFGHFPVLDMSCTDTKRVIFYQKPDKSVGPVTGAELFAFKRSDIANVPRPEACHGRSHLNLKLCHFKSKFEVTDMLSSGNFEQITLNK